MTVLATDQGVPNRVSSQQATVRINILRNLNCPVFNNLPTNISISQSTGLGTRVYNVSATDLDTDVCSLLVSKSSKRVKINEKPNILLFFMLCMIDFLNNLNHLLILWFNLFTAIIQGHHLWPYWRWQCSNLLQDWSNIWFRNTQHGTVLRFWYSVQGM